VRMQLRFEANNERPPSSHRGHRLLVPPAGETGAFKSSLIRTAMWHHQRRERAGEGGQVQTMPAGFGASVDDVRAAARAEAAATAW
jgi:hypothetical protein